MVSTEPPKARLSISFVVVFVLTVFSLAGTFSVLWLSKNYSESALHTLADDVILRTLDDTAEHIRIVLKPAVDAVSIVSDIVPDDADVELNDSFSKELIKMMYHTLDRTPNLYSVYFANENGEFFLAGKRKRFENNEKKFYFNKEIVKKNGQKIVHEYWRVSDDQVDKVFLPNDSYDPRRRPWYERAKALKKAVWTSPYIFYITKKPGITYAEPIYHDGKFVGVVAADLEISTVSDYLLDGVFTKDTKIFALDKNDNIMAHSDFSNKYNSLVGSKKSIPKSVNFHDGVLNALNAQVNEDYKFRQMQNVRLDDELYKGVLSPFNIYGLDLLVGVYTPAIDYLAPFHNKFEKLVIVCVMLLVLAVALSKIVSFNLAKPFKELSKATENAKELKFDKFINIQTNLREVSATQYNFNQMLENLKNYQQANELLSETLHNAHVDTLYRLAMAAEHKDQYTYDHLKRVSDISVLVGETLGLSKHDTELLRHASAMHDVGKLGIPDNILMKPGKLTKEEFEIIKTHSQLGAKILDRPSSEEMQVANVVALSHHEKWNGTGYPHNLSGDNIPLFGRIVSVADVIDALLSRRPYKEPFSFEKTIQIVGSERGEHFDPELADIILENQDRLRRLVGLD
jgi:putative two-component system response regulator